MEKLKSFVPNNLRRIVENGNDDDLLSTSSSLIQLFLSLQQFHQLVRDLAEPDKSLFGKNFDAALKFKKKGNFCYSNGDIKQALAYYNQALRVAPVDATDEMDRNLVATLFLNRASALHKNGLLRECLRDCNRAIRICLSYAKAWYRRGMTNASLLNYEDAVNDLTISKDMESSLGGKRHIESELKTLLDLYKKGNSVVEQARLNDSTSTDHLLSVPHQIKLQCVTTPDKGRGLASDSDIPQTSLVHIEEPLAAIILKECRETHCHYCFNELPADVIPCPSCSMTLYCSEHCQEKSGGKVVRKDDNFFFKGICFSNDLGEYITRITLEDDPCLETEQVQEHKHECQGGNWPTILPSNVVLAGRILVKSIWGVSIVAPNILENLSLSHCFSKLPPESKLDLHIYSIVLLLCLRKSYSSELPISGAFVSQIVILLSQIKVNSMAISCMKSSDVYCPPDLLGTTSSIINNGQTTSVEQVRVGQAIYKFGSLFNHSCMPNIHAYFLSRKLLIRTTEFVAAYCPLELTYGPEVGKWDSNHRHKFLEDEYFFHCRCRGCFEINTSDLVFNGFCCTNLNCSGVVLDGYVAKNEQNKFEHISSGFTHNLQAGKVTHADTNEVVDLLFERRGSSFRIDPGYCLKCGSLREMESSHRILRKTQTSIRRLEYSLVSKEISFTQISESLRSLELLRSVLHPYNKRIAEVLDSIAQANCLVGDLQAGKDQCKASIKILEKLYGANHIVVGYELVKLSSIELTLTEVTAAETIARVCIIFNRYYGSHADMVFPYLPYLKKKGQGLAW